MTGKCGAGGRNVAGTLINVQCSYFYNTTFSKVINPIQKSKKTGTTPPVIRLRKKAKSIRSLTQPQRSLTQPQRLYI